MNKTRILSVAAMLGSLVFCFWIGFHEGRKPVREKREVDIILALGVYQAVVATNWSRVHSFVDLELMALVREYESAWGVPTGTGKFAREFAQAKSAVDRIQTNLVPLIPALTNAFPRLKVEIEK